MGLSRCNPRCPELLRFIDSQSDLTFINGYHFIQLGGRIVVHIKFAYFLRTKDHFLQKKPAAIKDPFLRKKKKKKKCGGWWKTMLVVFVAVPRSAKKFHLACFDRIPWRFWLKHVEGRSYRKLVAKRKHHAEIDEYSLEIGLFSDNWSLPLQFHYDPLSGWWFQRCLIFTPIWGRFPIWLIFFKGVETTTRLCM